MPYEHAYVFGQGADGNSHLAGSIHVSDNVGYFSYADAWLAQPWAYALDPQNLPLATKRYRALTKHGVHGVFRDAAPDDWGTRIMLLRHQHAPENELERLIRTSGAGVGCLRFSLSRASVKIPLPLPSMAHIREIASIAGRVDALKTLSHEELVLLEPGSSMGGARPKITVSENDKSWLVKFRKQGDLVNVPLLEYCSMSFLRENLGLHVPEVKLLSLGDHDAFAIRRFDKNVHFISANSLFNQERIRMIEDSKYNPYSYCNLATLIRKHCVDFKSDMLELFKRMLANIVMGNTDDHARNHAFVFDIESQAWRLSPCYDMLPIVATSTRTQALGVGKNGAKATIENALSYADLFGLKHAQAKEIADEVLSIYQNYWLAHCTTNGLSSSDLSWVERAFILKG